MDAKICDKCGETYSPRSSSPMNLCEAGIYVINGKAYTTSIRGVKFDLCPACTERLWNWLHNKSQPLEEGKDETPPSE